MKRNTNRLVANVTAAALSVVSAQLATAASDTWTGVVDGAWENTGNWSGGAVPSAGETATFTGIGGPANATVTVDAGRNVGSLLFDATDTFFKIGATANAGETLTLSNGGAIYLSNTLAVNPSGSLSIGINAPLVLAGTGYTFTNNSNNTAIGIVVGGNIAGGAAGATVLNLNGDSITPIASVGPNVITGVISDGASSSVGIVKSGTGMWDLRPTDPAQNTYSGDTIITGGRLRFSSPGAASPNTKIIVDGGNARFSSTGATIGPIEIRNASGTGGIDASSGSTITNFKSESGPAIWLNYGSGSYVSVVNMILGLTGTTPMEGGIKLTANPLLGPVGLPDNTGKALDLGTVMRPFDIGSGADTNSYDLRTRGPITGGGPNGGIVKQGDGILRIDNGVNPFTGTVEVQDGTLLINNSDALTGLPALVMNGGTFHITSAKQQTFSSVTLKKGVIHRSDATSTLLAPSYTLNVASGDTGTIETVMADSGGASPVTKIGAGEAILNGTNTYTGVTTVEAGRLVLQNDGAQAPVLTGTGGADVKGGRLVFDYSAGDTVGPDVLAILDAGNDQSPAFSSGQIRTSNAPDGGKALGWKDDATNMQVTVAYTYKGDTNLDGQVTISDLGDLASNWQSTTASWAFGDFNYDGSVTISDLGDLASNWQAGVGSPLGMSFQEALAAVGFDGSAVPEPATMSLLGLLGACTLKRARRS